MHNVFMLGGNTDLQTTAKISQSPVELIKVYVFVCFVIDISKNNIGIFDIMF